MSEHEETVIICSCILDIVIVVGCNTMWMCIASSRCHQPNHTHLVEAFAFYGHLVMCTMHVARIYTWPPRLPTLPTLPTLTLSNTHTHTDNGRNYGQKTARIPNAKSTIVGLIFSESKIFLNASELIFQDSSSNKQKWNSNRMNI